MNARATHVYIVYLNIEPSRTNTFEYSSAGYNQHIFTVGQLMTAFKASESPLLDAAKVCRMFLYPSENCGLEPQLEKEIVPFDVDRLLDTLPGGRTAETAFVLKVPDIFTDEETYRDVPVLKYNRESPLFELDSLFLAQTGLAEKKLVLYCRPQFHEQFDFLTERVLKNKVVGWILGPPGTGKSTTALAFAATLDRAEWTIIWIHLDRFEDPLLVSIKGNVKKTLKFDYPQLGAVLARHMGKKTFLFIDGYAQLSNSDKHDRIFSTCLNWFKTDQGTRRFVVVSSMAARYKPKPTFGLSYHIQEFRVLSWLKAEYLDAVSHNAVLANVLNALDSSDLVSTNIGLPSKKDRADLVDSKYYLAGGCSRSMFLKSSSDVILHLKAAVKEVSNVSDFMRARVGPRSSEVINRIFGAYNGKFSNIRSSIISPFCGYLLALNIGPAFITHVMDTLQSVTPRLDGWLVEMYVFASLSKGGLKLVNSDGGPEFWPECHVDQFTIGEFPSLSHPIWLKPNKWNQGGYDGIFVDKSNSLVRFIQVTRGDTHSLKLQFFVMFLKSLRDSDQSFQIENLQIIFVVDQAKMESFKVGPVYGKVLLSEFGWKPSMVEIVGVDWRTPSHVQTSIPSKRKAPHQRKAK